MDDSAGQMSLINDTEEVLKFLEIASKNSILNDHAVHCRVTACNNLFSVLNDEERNADYVLEHLDLIVKRFRNKHGKVKDATLKVYKSRVKSSLEDYQSWSRDPIAWERSVLNKDNGQAQAKAKKEGRSPRKLQKQNGESNGHAHATLPGRRKISFPIRNGFDIEMIIPSDGLTSKDVVRLGLFLYPYCRDLDQKEEAAWAFAPATSH